MKVWMQGKAENEKLKAVESGRKRIHIPERG